ncbi:Uroporphyrinogen-III decarboxylase [Malonomonas rubra DSM 5091]|uniref:Uroporphyrinogen-III decarboxylase n=1 Tax=Malonomonas rubra DSM 5091 TaxID=1122189 RepID=A0A1M6MZY3_MALRU|nr:uroporphyrinogen decarboxylase family protein [Malonomonas rubra]SHJ88936.1 Uroporphyrinogen-III decarboxylase [Malonomonas rubra DSM 5091]
MNSWERVFASVAGKPVDRRAVVPLLSLYGAKLTNCPLEKYYTDSNAYIAGQQAVYDNFEPDVLFGPFCFAKEGLPFGTTVKYFENQPPNMSRAAFRDCRKISEFTVAELLQHPVVQYQENAVDGLVKKFSNEVPIAPIMLGPLDLPAIIVGVENWLQGLLFNEEDARAALDVSVPYFVARCNRMFALGAPMIIISGLFVNPKILTYGLAESIAIPVMQDAFSQLQGPVIFHSGGAAILPFLDLFSNLPNVAGFVLNPGEDPLLARGKIASGQLLDGNLDGPNFHRMTADGVYRQALELLHHCRGETRFTLGTSGADIRPETPIENIQALKKAAEAEHVEEKVKKGEILGISCGVFSDELHHLQETGAIDFPIVYLDSMLHMRPKKLEEGLNKTIQQQLQRYDKIILLYGDCHARMFQAEQPGRVLRLQGSNCIEIILGKERYREIRQKGSFVLLHEWTLRWHRVFTKELGLDEKTARQFMPEHHSELLYLDNGCQPIPEKELQECSDFCGLPWRVETLDFNPLLREISATLETLQEAG